MTRYNYLKLQHRCVRCGEKDARTEDGKALCMSCKDKQTEYYRPKYKSMKTQQKQRYNHLAEQGVCVMCGKEPASEGLRLCRKCRLRKSQYNHKSYEKRKERKTA